MTTRRRKKRRVTGGYNNIEPSVFFFSLSLSFSRAPHVLSPRLRWFSRLRDGGRIPRGGRRRRCQSKNPSSLYKIKLKKKKIEFLGNPHTRIQVLHTVGRPIIQKRQKPSCHYNDFLCVRIRTYHIVNV